jgi:uncharacterized membrane protein
MSTATTPLARPRASGLTAKHIFWIAMGLAGLSVLCITDYPILTHPKDPYTLKLIADRFLIIPHAIAGVVATFLGPFQFSTRFRQRHLSLHRLMGKVYVVAICVAAPMAFALGLRGFEPALKFMGGVQSVLWFLCTALAFITARNRQIAVHRQWMVRSYAFTLNFIFSRFLNFIPAYFHISDNGLAAVLGLLTATYFFIPDMVFNWRELTHRRA